MGSRGLGMYGVRKDACSSKMARQFSIEAFCPESYTCLSVRNEARLGRDVILTSNFCCCAKTGHVGSAHCTITSVNNCKMAFLTMTVAKHYYFPTTWEIILAELLPYN